ncbi:MAG: hypothetical protein D8M59_00125 [Planctomycetes bacterium]|nr:hypothetical protein [Planctomycetota bacterium]
MVNLVFYTKHDCPLCDRLRELIHESLGRRWAEQVSITDVYIENDRELMKKYALRIPVVLYNERILFEGRPDAQTVQQALAEIGLTTP